MRVVRCLYCIISYLMSSGEGMFCKPHKYNQKPYCIDGLRYNALSISYKSFEMLIEAVLKTPIRKRSYMIYI